ncbi:hypothetical protein PMAYCL1PPCAC_07864, partial [Pristionchus mayeri]
AQLDPPLAIVKEWQRKSFEFNNQSKDRLLSLIMKTFETMSDVLSADSDRELILCSLLSLDSQRSITMKFENNQSDVIRTLVFGLIQALQVTLFELTEKSTDGKPASHSNVDQYTQTENNAEDLSGPNNCPSSSSSFVSEYNRVHQFTIAIPKKEASDDVQYNDANNFLLDDMQFKDDELTNSSSVNRGNASPSEVDDLDDDILWDDEYQAEEQGKSQQNNISSQSGVNNAKKRKYAELNETTKIPKLSATKMLCPIEDCEYFSHCVTNFLAHLRYKHDTTLKLANAILKCECGQKCFSRAHSERCKIANFEVIQVSCGPIRRRSEAKTANVRCIIDGCEKFLKNPYNYGNHLRRSHSSSLRMEGYYILCECGTRITSITVAENHHVSTGKLECIIRRNEQRRKEFLCRLLPTGAQLIHKNKCDLKVEFVHFQ